MRSACAAPQNLTWFEVAAGGVISMPGIAQPKARYQVFEQIDPSAVHSSEELIDLVAACEPLLERFREHGQRLVRHHDQARVPSETLVDRLLRPAAQGHAAQRLIMRALREDPQEGWRDWIELRGDAGLQEFQELIREWLAEPIDWDEIEHFDTFWNGQAAALAHFDDLPGASLRALGIRIVDGEHPGSTFCAAVLRGCVEAANSAAEQLGLDCRFRGAAEPLAEHGSIERGGVHV